MEIIQNPVKITLNESTLHLTIEYDGQVWSWVEGFRPHITFVATAEQKA